MTTTVGPNHPPAGHAPVWPAAILVGTFATVALFATLIHLGDRKTEATKATPTRLTIGFVRKAPPAARPQKAAPPRRVLQRRAAPPRKPPPVTREVESAPPTAPPQPSPERVPPPPATPPAEASSPLQPVPTYQLTGLPQFIHKESPVYPPHLRRLGREATVKLELLIDREGKVRDIRVLKSAGAGFDRAAIEAIRASSFTPGNVNGTPVPVLMRVPVRFRLR